MRRPRTFSRRSIEQRQLGGIWTLDPSVPEGDERRVDAWCALGERAIALRDSGRQDLDRRVEEPQLHCYAVFSRPRPAQVASHALPDATLVDHGEPSEDERLGQLPLEGLDRDAGVL